MLGQQQQQQQHTTSSSSSKDSAGWLRMLLKDRRYSVSVSPQ
jgi:hypothetical protein